MDRNQHYKRPLDGADPVLQPRPASALIQCAGHVQVDATRLIVAQQKTCDPEAMKCGFGDSVKFSDRACGRNRSAYLAGDGVGRSNRSAASHSTLSKLFTLIREILSDGLFLAENEVSSYSAESN